MALSQEESESVEDRSTIQILKDTASELSSLLEEADLAAEEGDYGVSITKFRERAELIVDLPHQLSKATDRKTRKGCEDILHQVNIFSNLAIDALKSGGKLDLGLLLRPKLDGPDDLGPLENLIESIKE